jgi:hypothetical protein
VAPWYPGAQVQRKDKGPVSAHVPPLRQGALAQSSMSVHAQATARKARVADADVAAGEHAGSVSCCMPDCSCRRSGSWFRRTRPVQAAAVGQRTRVGAGAAVLARRAGAVVGVDAGAGTVHDSPEGRGR